MLLHSKKYLMKINHNYYQNMQKCKIKNIYVQVKVNFTHILNVFVNKKHIQNNLIFYLEKEWEKYNQIINVHVNEIIEQNTLSSSIKLTVIFCI